MHFNLYGQARNDIYSSTLVLSWEVNVESLLKYVTSLTCCVIKHQDNLGCCCWWALPCVSRHFLLYVLFSRFLPNTQETSYFDIIAVKLLCVPYCQFVWSHLVRSLIEYNAAVRLLTDNAHITDASTKICNS